MWVLRPVNHALAEHVLLSTLRSGLAHRPPLWSGRIHTRPRSKPTVFYLVAIFSQNIVGRFSRGAAPQGRASFSGGHLGFQDMARDTEAGVAALAKVFSSTGGNLWPPFTPVKCFSQQGWPGRTTALACPLHPFYDPVPRAGVIFWSRARRLRPPFPIGTPRGDATVR